MREIWNLNRDWRFALAAPANNKKISHADAYEYAHAGSIGGTAGVNFDDSDWRIVHLPHDYMSEAPFSADAVHSHGFKCASDAWYRKRFLLPETMQDKHLLLVFDGIAMQARVYLNGSLMARSYTAYTPIVIDITDRAYYGDRVNTLVVAVDGHALEGWFYEGAGIYRDVRLIVKESLHFVHDGIFLCPVQNADGSWRVDWRAEIEYGAWNFDTPADSAPFRVKISLFDGEVCHASHESAAYRCTGGNPITAEGSFAVPEPALWDVGHPQLYRACVTLVGEDEETDTESFNIGFRTFTADSERGFFLNGQPFLMKGTCNHQDHAGVGCAVPDALHEYRIRRLKEMGCNTYRCAHSMQSAAVLDACDRLGMLVIDENRHFEANDETVEQVRALVRRDRNHPSLVMYSLFNEEALQATHEGINIFRRLKYTVRQHDASRPVTGALGGGVLDDNGTALYMDITGINYSLTLAEAFHQKHPDRPVVGTENNSVVSTRGCYRTDPKQNLCASYDEDVVAWGHTVRQTWEFVRNHPWYGGICIWTGFDYRGEPTPYTWPSVSSQFGLMDTCGFPKEGYHHCRICYREEPILHITPHWNWSDGSVIRVQTPTNCEEAELFLNGVSLGRQPADVCRYPEWQVPFTPGTLYAIGYRQGISAAEDTVRTAGPAVRVQLLPDRTTIENDGRDAVCVNVCALDAAGNVVPCADDLLHIAVGDDGVLLGVGNGDPNSHEDDHAPMHHLFAGWAQVILSAKPGAKAVSLTVTADGLCGDTVHFTVCDVAGPQYLPSTDSRAVHGAMVTYLTYPTRESLPMDVSQYDMNTMEYIVFDTYSLKPVFSEGWRLLRIPIIVPRAAANGAAVCRVTILRLAAKHAAVMLGDQILHDAPHGDGPLILDFPAEAGKLYTLVLLIEGTGGESGICGGVDVSILS